MNIWIEYWKRQPESTLNNHAQMKQNAKWIPPDESDITKRFCQNMEQATKLSQSLFDQGYYAQIRTDGP